MINGEQLNEAAQSQRACRNLLKAKSVLDGKQLVAGMLFVCRSPVVQLFKEIETLQRGGRMVVENFLALFMS